MALVASSSRLSTSVNRSVLLDTPRRAFASSTRCLDHYGTLGVPRTASKAQIKSHYYKLSKKHHPDVSKDPDSSRIFSAASEAYSVLVDDRQRRAYDRSLLHRSAPLHPQAYPYSPHEPPPTSGPRASYAWEYSHRSRSAGFRQPRPDYAPPPNRSQGPAAGGHYSPPQGSHHDVLRGSRKKEEEAQQEMDRIRNTSSLWRAFQVVAALTASLMLIGGGRGGG